MPAWAPIEVRLLRLSRDDPSGCRLWTGCIDVDGYGKFNGPHASTAHRSAYIEWVGEIPEGLEIDHICRVRNCINPDHLRVVQHAENVAASVLVPERHRNTRKTHCKRGHPLSGDNLFFKKAYDKVTRQCRVCESARKKQSDLRRRARNPVAWRAAKAAERRIQRRNRRLSKISNIEVKLT